MGVFWGGVLAKAHMSDSKFPPPPPCDISRGYVPLVTYMGPHDPKTACNDPISGEMML